MLRWVYILLMHLVLPFLPLRLWWRGRKEPGYRHHWGERLGVYKTRVLQPVIWVHAVSLGETRAAQPLIKALAERYPDYTLLVTHMTATGRSAGEELFPGAMIAFLPYDVPFAVAGFLDHFRPRLGVLMETELWPNLVRGCKVRGIPVVLANARLSARSARGYERIASLARGAFSDLAAVGAQSEADAKRIAGFTFAPIPPVVVTGNIKFDIETPHAAAAVAAELRAIWGAQSGARTVFLAASTREGEEALILDAWMKHPIAKIASALLVIVPRHPQRFDAVAALLDARGIRYARRSSARSASDAPVFLGDSMGELAGYYRAADVAFIGGSLLPFGAQNLIEACAAGVPVLVGPSSFNFARAAELALEARAAHRVENAGDLVIVVERLLTDPASRRLMGRRGREFADAHRGATARTMELIGSVFKG